LWVRFVAKKLSEQALSDRYQRDIADLLSEAEDEPLFDRDRRLIFLCYNISEILPILLGLCIQIADEAVTQLDVGPSLADPAEQMRAAIQELIAISPAVERASGVDDNAFPADKRLEQLHFDLRRLLGRLKRDRRLDRGQKLGVLRFNIDKILSILKRLCVQAADEPVGASDIGLSLIGATKQMLAVVKDLMRLDRAFMARRRRAGRRKRLH
jgi:hypothetical protein